MYARFNLQYDNYILNQLENYNFGYNEILSVGKYKIFGDSYVKRSLIKYDATAVNNFIINNNINDYDLSLHMTVATSSLMNYDTNINLYMLSSSWTEGNGHEGMTYIEGSTWNYRAEEYYMEWDNPGGDYILSHSVSASLNYDDRYPDISYDIKNIHSLYTSGSYTNNGFLLKLDDSLEESVLSPGEIKFYSRHTNTIYKPTINISWDDSSYNTGSMELVNSSDLIIYSNNLKNKVDIENSNIRINLIVKQLYQQKTFNTIASGSIKYALPSTATYSIIEAATNKIIIPHSSYSKISCDGNKNYINLHNTMFNKKRIYNLYIKIDNHIYESGTLYT
ncbi:MAG TPA: hypothetical protein PLY35_09000 [Thermotogota bacterium]|nr:hypothetical protein [Thermotogota bacterium]